ncbi:hypothetical protein HGG76_02465 [Ochrobactrum tritici]|nr:hypothetical protein [Brucella tritici]
MESKELVALTGKGEARMKPVDVDTIDNVLNAQAAYLEAVSTAYEHFNINVNAKHPDEAIEG